MFFSKKNEGKNLEVLENKIEIVPKNSETLKAEFITKDIKWTDVTNSATAKKIGIKNDIPENYKINAYNLAVFVVQKIFDKFGRGNINSWFRSPKVNKLANGASNSSHLTGEAVDLDGYKSNKVVADWIKDNILYDQLIYEQPDKYGEPAWIHVSYRENANRNQTLVYSKISGKWKYYLYSDFYK